MFLFVAALFEDGANADSMASDYKLVRSQVNKATKLKIKLAPERLGVKIVR